MALRVANLLLEPPNKQRKLKLSILQHGSHVIGLNMYITDRTYDLMASDNTRSLHRLREEYDVILYNSTRVGLSSYVITDRWKNAVSREEVYPTRVMENQPRLLIEGSTEENIVAHNGSPFNYSLHSNNYAFPSGRGNSRNFLYKRFRCAALVGSMCPDHGA
jgi:hypothetical protein